jgi:23S rRNA (uracil1939-C5)-methyltransferase
MAKKKVSGAPLVKNEVYESTIEDVTLDGNGVCRVDGYTMFLPMTAVGDRIRLKAVKLQKNYGFGIVEQVVTPAASRVPSDCPIYKQCGGCSFRHMTYEEELRLKQKTVEDAFARLGGFDLPAEPILGCNTSGLSPDHYRNKAQFPLGVDADGRAVAGFYAKRSHRIIPGGDCPIQDRRFAPIVRTLTDCIDRFHIPVYREDTHTGILRHLFLRVGRGTGEIMVCLVATTDKLPCQQELVQALTAAHPEIVSIMLNLNPNVTNVIMGKETRCLYGKPDLEDELLGVRFRIAPEAFYQVNAEQAGRLYSIGFDYAGFQGNETLLDLYCGIGSIGLTAFRRVEKLIGVEVVPQAIESAKKNAALSGIPEEKARFFCADAGEAAGRLAAEGLRPDVIIIDPPRKGCDGSVLDSIRKMGPEKVVMISCNPATAARDAKILCDEEHGYRLVRYRAVDMFPRTGHVEAVVLMSRVKE